MQLRFYFILFYFFIREMQLEICTAKDTLKFATYLLLSALKIAIISSSQSPSQMEQENHPNVTNIALIVGVTGMAGLSLAEALKSPNALGSPWQVYGAARRPKPSWFPSSIVDKYITFDATNSGDTHDKLAHIANKVTHVYWVAIQEIGRASCRERVCT